MAKNIDIERQGDLRRLDSAIAQVEELLDAPIPTGDIAPQVLKMARDSRLQAADRLVSLLERRAALLGLDAATGKNAPTDSGIRPGSIAELEQKLALVEKNRAS